MTLTELRAALEKAIEEQAVDTGYADRINAIYQPAMERVVMSRRKVNALRAQIIEMEKGESNG